MKYKYLLFTYIFSTNLELYNVSNVYIVHHDCYDAICIKFEN